MPWLPDGIRLVEMIPEPGGARLRWEVGGDCACFRGHFDAEPILPGIAHLALVADAVARMTRRGWFVAEVKSVRLRQAVRPGDPIEGTVEGPDEAGSVRFDLRVPSGSAASGVIVLEATDA